MILRYIVGIKNQKNIIPVIDDSAVVHQLRNAPTVRVDHWLEWDTTTFVSL